ncbi:hypothetical protein VV867_25280 [Pseudomonas sp. JH-2]|nr:hypothetical protein [Pseudomonas sp. JH-2]
MAVANVGDSVPTDKLRPAREASATTAAEQVMLTALMYVPVEICA